MVPQLLDNGIIKVARVAQEATGGNVEGVLETGKSIVDEGDLGPLPQLEPPGLVLIVESANKGVVIVEGGRVDVGLQLDYVRVGDVLCVRRRQKWGSISVDGPSAEQRVGVGNHAQQLDGGEMHGGEGEYRL
jgi:hypothetical protein